MNRTYYPLLDFLRAFLALLVFYSHTYREFSDMDFLGIADKALHLGSWGITGFFILSGYLIAQSAEKIDTKTFFINRVTRLFPALIICAFISILIHNQFIGSYSDDDIKVFLSSISLTYKFFEISPFSTAIWTLLWEVIFYFFIGLSIFVSRISRKRITLEKIYLATFSLLLIWQLSPVIDMTGINLDWFLIFFSGVFLFKFLESGLSKKRFLLLTFISVFSFLAYVRFTLWFEIFLILVLFTIYISAHISSHNEKIIKISKFIGESTYTSYLLHMSLGFLVIMQFKDKFGSFMDQDLVYIYAFVFFTFSAGLIGYFLDKPLRYFLREKMLNI